MSCAPTQAPTSTDSTVTPVVAHVPGPAQPWQSLTWRRLNEGEPLSTYLVKRARHGFIGYSLPIQTETGARSQLAISADAVSWAELPRTALGSDSIVVGLHTLGETMVALTLKGGVEYGSLEPPLRAWTSLDGTNWTLQAEPVNVSSIPGSAGDVMSAESETVVLVAHKNGEAIDFASTSDGRTWTAFAAAGLPAGFDLRTLGALPSGFVITGNVDLGETIGAVAAWSTDGRNWEVATFPVPARAADIVASGSQGMIVATQVAVEPSGPTWWASGDGHNWEKVDDFAPLGIWQGPGEGTGLVPNGELAGSGERMVAYDTFTGAHGWTSFDGLTWTDLVSRGDLPTASSNSRFNVEPVGLVWSDGEQLWLGVPSTD